MVHEAYQSPLDVVASFGTTLTFVVFVHTLKLEDPYTLHNYNAFMKWDTDVAVSLEILIAGCSKCSSRVLLLCVVCCSIVFYGVSDLINF